MENMHIPVADSPDDLTPEQLASILTMMAPVTKWFAACKKHAMAELTEGGDVPGWTLGAGKRSRDWISEEAAKEAMAGVGINDPYKRSLLSPAEAEKKIPADSKSDMESGWEWHDGNPALKQTAGSKASGATQSKTEKSTSKPLAYGW